MNIFPWDVLSYTENGLVRDLSNLDIQLDFYRTNSQSGITVWYAVEGAQVDTMYQSDYFISNEGRCLELGTDKLDLRVEGMDRLLRLEGELQGLTINILA